MALKFNICQKRKYVFHNEKYRLNVGLLGSLARGIGLGRGCRLFFLIIGRFCFSLLSNGRLFGQACRPIGLCRT